MSVELELFSDYICPWCYIMAGRIGRIQANYDIAIIWRCYPLHPDTPKEGRDLKDVYRRYPFPMDELLARQRRLAAAIGLPYGERTKTYNSRLAQELGKWADSVPGGDRYREQVFRAYFDRAENLAREEVLLAVVERAGLDVAEAKRALDERTFADAVDRDWQRAADLGVTAVPTLVRGKHQLNGARDYELLAAFVMSCGARRR